MTTPGWRMIASAAELERAVARWSALPEIALDTEFVFERTFWPRPGLVQVAAGDEVALVDAVALPDLSALAPLLRASAPTKILHAAGGDVALLERTAGTLPRPLFDTQIAAAFCGLGAGLSYVQLLVQLFGVEIEKAETRTDWTRRPLAPEQLRYAAADVAHLPAAAAQLRSRLVAIGRLEWAREESEALLDPDPQREDPELAWTRLPGVGKLPPRGRAVAHALARWRELAARRLDLPRTFLLRDETIVALARKPAREITDLRRAPGFQPGRHARFAEEIVEIVAGAADAPERQAPAPPLRREIPRELDQAVAQRVEKAALELQVPAEFLLSRRRRASLLAGWDRRLPLATRLAGWRRAALASSLDDL
jgi:ribonuclease D